MKLVNRRKRVQRTVERWTRLEEETKKGQAGGKTECSHMLMVLLSGTGPTLLHLIIRRNREERRIGLGAADVGQLVY